jgi:glycosyltransferase involved in cell wall biosynthesis
MRILVVTQYFWPEDFRINDLVKEWVRRGHEVTVLTGIPNYPDGEVFAAYRQRPADFLHFEGARLVRIPMVARGRGGLRLVLNYLSFALSGMVIGAWRLRAEQADVVFVFEPSPVTVGLPAVVLGKLKGAPIVFWVLDLWPETLAAVGVVRSARVLAWAARLVRFIYDRCALVLGQSKGFLTSIRRHCSDASKVRYFPNWAEDVYQTGINASPAPEVPAQAGVFTVLFAGNIGDAQDMPAVLDAVEQLRDRTDIRWVIVGDGRKWEWLRYQVQTRGLQDCVVLPGRFAADRMPSFFAHADALLVSLKRDPVFSMTIPGKVQSYLLAGLPLLGMLDGEGASVIQEARAGLTCQAGDGAALAQAVLDLLAMPLEQRRQLGQSGRSYAQTEFGRPLLMDRMEALLAEAAAGQRAKV